MTRDEMPAVPLKAGDEETDYQIGYRDGYEKAVQDCDILTGGTGVYFASTFSDDCRTPEAMKALMAERYDDLACLIKPDDPYAALDWRTVAGERVAVVPCWGERPAFIRDDDEVRLDWTGQWFGAHHVSNWLWAEIAAVILRAREQNGEGA